MAVDSIRWLWEGNSPGLALNKQATKSNCSGFWQNLLTARAHLRCSLFDPLPSAEWTTTRVQIIEFRGQLLWGRNHKNRNWGRMSGYVSQEHRRGTDHDFVLSCEVGRLTQQLALRHSDRAGSLSYQHCVVKLHPSWCWGDQVSALWAYSSEQRGVKSGDKQARSSKAFFVFIDEQKRCAT